jgi:hypothetical protein
MKILASLLIFLFTCTAFAQDTVYFVKPDFKAIEKSIKDKNSPYYFDRLFERFKKGDASFTLEEKYHLYYGYSFTDGYQPYFASDNVKEINRLVNIDNLGKQDMEKIITLSDEVLQGYPFNLSMMGYRAYFFKELGKQKQSDAESARANIILDAILNSGDGISKDTCFYIISVGNEYDLINILGFVYGGEQRLVDGKYDYLTVDQNENSIRGFYFDVSRIMATFK